MLLRILNEYERMIPTDLLIFLRFPIQKNTGNPNLPNPTPSIAVLTTLANDFETLINNA